jgi:hypothetical protein
VWSFQKRERKASGGGAQGMIPVPIRLIPLPPRKINLLYFKKED